MCFYQVSSLNTNKIKLAVDDWLREEAFKIIDRALFKEMREFAEKREHELWYGKGEPVTREREYPWTEKDMFKYPSEIRLGPRLFIDRKKIPYDMIEEEYLEKVNTLIGEAEISGSGRIIVGLNSSGGLEVT